MLQALRASAANSKQQGLVLGSLGICGVCSPSLGLLERFARCEWFGRVNRAASNEQMLHVCTFYVPGVDSHTSPCKINVSFLKSKTKKDTSRSSSSGRCLPAPRAGWLLVTHPRAFLDEHFKNGQSHDKTRKPQYHVHVVLNEMSKEHYSVGGILKSDEN